MTFLAFMLVGFGLSVLVLLALALVQAGLDDDKGAERDAEGK